MGRFSDAQIRSIILGARDFRVVPFPGAEGLTVAVRLLSESELDGCRIEAQRDVRKIGGSRSWDPKHVVDIDPDLLTRLVEREVVRRAFYDPDTIGNPEPVPFFDAKEDVGALDTETVTALAATYLEHAEAVNPLQTLDDEAVEDLISQLGKQHAPEVLLHALDASTLRRCVLTLAARLRETSPTGRSSSTSPA